MAQTYKIFTVENLECQDNIQNIQWHLNIKRTIKNFTDKQIKFVYTLDYFNKPYTKEVINWELNQIQNSDIIIIDLSDIANNIFAHYVIGYVNMLNKITPKPIYIIGIGHPNINNSLIENSIFKTTETIEDAAKYITNYLLI